MKKGMGLVCLMALLLLLTGCTSAETPFTQKEYTAEGAVQTLLVDVRDRRVEVVPAADEQLRIMYAENEKEFYHLDLADGALTMRGQTSKTWQDYFGGNAGIRERTITLHLPATLLDSVTIRTTNEDIVIGSLAAGKAIDLRTNGGSVLFDCLDAGEAITLEAKNGSVKGAITGRYEDFAIAAQVKKGKSNLPTSKAEGVKKLSVTVNNGDAEIAFAPAE